MNKIICDVCGTDYPETAAQCPICGCAAAGAQTSAGNEVAETEERTYNYVKGGRYSKANVRKRLKENQVYYDQSPASDAEAEYEDDDRDDTDEEEDGGSNRGLVVVVVILLLAIVAVASYIAITFFDIKLPEFGAKPTTTQNMPNSTTIPTTTEPAATDVACTGLIVGEAAVNLTSAESTWLLSVITEPEDTTDIITFVPGDESVATVNENGLVTAVGNGETTITIICGDIQKTINVICTIEEPEVTEPEETEPEETEPEETDPEETEPAETKTYALRINGRKPNYGTEQAAEATIKIGEELNIKVVDENGQRVEVEWTASKSGIVSIGSNTVTGESAGTVVITAEIDGQELVCTFRVKA